MIFDANQFKDEIADIRAAIEEEDGMKIAMALFRVWDKGIGWERERIIPIIQRMAVNPQPIVAAIRKPLR
jgi:hypothetical protein